MNKKFNLYKSKVKKLDLYLVEEVMDSESYRIIGVFIDSESAKERYNKKYIQNSSKPFWAEYYIFKIESNKELDWNSLNKSETIEPIKIL